MDAREIPTNSTAFEKLARSRAGRPHSKSEIIDRRVVEVCEPGIEISHPASRNRHLVLTRIAGEPDKVLDEVAYRLGRDTCTPMYEHMLLRVGTVEIEDENWIRVVLSKSLYAGD